MRGAADAHYKSLEGKRVLVTGAHRVPGLCGAACAGPAIVAAGRVLV